jgi:hypothetical protein
MGLGVFVTAPTFISRFSVSKTQKSNQIVLILSKNHFIFFYLNLNNITSITKKMNPFKQYPVLRCIIQHSNNKTFKALCQANKQIHLLTYYPELKRSLLELASNKPWDWYGLSQNPNITWEIVQTNPDIPWKWYRLSRNPNITWEIVKENPDKPWDWSGLSLNPNITWEIVQANPDKPWSWDGLSLNPSITWEIVLSNPDKPWNWYWLSKHPNITWEIVLSNPDKPWNWEFLSQHLPLYQDSPLAKHKNQIKKY